MEKKITDRRPTAQEFRQTINQTATKSTNIVKYYIQTYPDLCYALQKIECWKKETR